MQARRICFGLLLALAVVSTAGAGASAGTHAWLVIQPPYRTPGVGETFTADIKVSTWGGVVGALEAAIHYDPALFRVLAFDAAPGSPFEGNCAADVDSYASGNTGFACFQVDLAQTQQFTLIGAFTLEVLAAGGLAADITIEPIRVVDVAWQHVEVHTESLLKAGLSLGPGWNLVTMSHGPETDITAQTLLDILGSQEGAVSEIDRWLDGGWDAHVGGLPFNDFPIRLGEGYFIKGHAGSSHDLTGWAPWGGIGFILQPGWNLVGVPYPASGHTAQSLLSGIAGQGGACTEIDRWSQGAWDAHIKDLPFNDFEILPSEGYFVKCSQASGFIPDSPAGQAAGYEAPAAAPVVAEAASTPTISGILVTDRRDVALTVVWRTDLPSDSWIEFGPTPALGGAAHDVRGPSAISTLHRVTLAGLNPESAVYYRVHSGATVADEEGEPFVANTRSTGTPATPRTAYGRAAFSDGSPATGALVIARLADAAGGESEPLSVLVDGSGWWYMSLPETACDGTSLVVEAIGPQGETGALSHPACECTPAPALTLGSNEGMRLWLPILMH